MFVCLMWGIYYKNLARTPEIVWHCFCCCCWCCCSLHELIYCCCRLSFIFHYLVAATFFYTIEMHVYFIHIVFVVVFVFCIHNMNTHDDCDDDSSGFFPKSNKTETKTKTWNLKMLVMSPTSLFYMFVCMCLFVRIRYWKEVLFRLVSTYLLDSFVCCICFLFNFLFIFL